MLRLRTLRPASSPHPALRIPRSDQGPSGEGADTSWENSGEGEDGSSEDSAEGCSETSAFLLPLLPISPGSWVLPFLPTPEAQRSLKSLGCLLYSEGKGTPQPLLPKDNFQAARGFLAGFAAPSLVSLTSQHPSPPKQRWLLLCTETWKRAVLTGCSSDTSLRAAPTTTLPPGDLLQGWGQWDKWEAREAKSSHLPVLVPPQLFPKGLHQKT